MIICYSKIGIKMIDKTIMNIETISGRFLYLMDKTKLNQSQFASKCGTSSAYISNIINDGKQPGTKIYAALKKNLPEINLNWLITGQGSYCTEFDNVVKTDRTEQHTTPTIDHVEKIENLLERSQDTLDRYLSLVEQQQSIINNLSQTLNRVANNKVF